jgi:hypothetical protein
MINVSPPRQHRFSFVIFSLKGVSQQAGWSHLSPIIALGSPIRSKRKRTIDMT